MFSRLALSLAVLIALFSYSNCGRVEFQSPESVVTQSIEQSSVSNTAPSGDVNVIQDGLGHFGLYDRAAQQVGGMYSYALPFVTPSEIDIKVPANCTALKTYSGVDQASLQDSPVTFEIQNGSQILTTAQLKKGEEPQRFEVDLKNVTQLKLRASSSTGAVAANWLEPHFICGDENKRIEADLDSQVSQEDVDRILARDSQVLTADTQDGSEPEVSFDNDAPSLDQLDSSPLAAEAEEPKLAQTILGLTTSQCATPTMKAFYVATNGSTDATTPGTSAKPFKTIQQAVLAMRKSTTKVTFIRTGTYVVSSPIVLDSRDNNVRLLAYPCENVIIDGARWLSGWKSEGSGIYSLAVNNPSTWRELYINGTRARPATVFNYLSSTPFTSDWMFAQGGPAKGQTPYDWFKFKSTNLNKSQLSDTTGVMVQGMAWDRQKDYVQAVKSIDWNASIIRLYNANDVTLADGTFRLFNHRSFLKTNGEFTWSWKSTRTLYVKVSSSDQLSKIALPSTANLIELRSANNILIKRIKFRNVPYTGSALLINGGGSHQIGANAFEFVGTGIEMNKTNDNLIGGNTFSSLGTHGMMMAQASRNKIYGNGFSGMGRVDKHSAGIFAYGSSDNQIAYNDFTQGSRYGIAIKDWDTTSARTTVNMRNTIERNYFSNLAQETGDGAAMEMLGRTQTITGSMIRNNIIQSYGGLMGNANKWSFGGKGFGIYMDDSTSGVTITQNLIKNTGAGLANIYLHGGDQNQVTHNVNILDDEKTDFIRMEKVYVGGDVNRKNTIQRNIVYANKALSNYVFYTSDTGIDKNSLGNSIDYNLLYNLKKYDGTLYEKNTLIGNPLFMNAASGNYALQPTSPALTKLGFKQPDLNNIGRSKYKHSSTFPAFWSTWP